MPGKSKNDAETEALVMDARRRSGLINCYLDLIPGRFYLSSEALQGHKPRNPLDPAEYKPTSQLIVEVMKAAAAAAPRTSASSTEGEKKAKKRAVSAAAPSVEKAASRADLKERLQIRIAELKEERRKKQSEADHENNAQLEKDTQMKGVATPPKKKQRQEESRNRPHSLVEDDVEAGRLSFEPRSSNLPYEAGVNQRGSKVRNLRTALRQEERRKQKLEGTEDADEHEALRGEYALDKALRRAKGEKVHDDVGRLRKQQKQLEVKKAKGHEKWNSRVESSKKAADEVQQKRKDNLQARRGKTQGPTGEKKGRMGFEGKTDYLNKEE